MNKPKLTNIMCSKKIAIVLSLFLACFIVAITCSCGRVDHTQVKDEMNVCIASEPQALDPALCSTTDGATVISHLFTGLSRWEKEEGWEPWLYPGMAEELVKPTQNADGTYTYIYKIRKGFTWNDGSPVTAHDYVYSWNRSVSVEMASDFSNFFENVVGYDEIWSDNPPEDAKLAVYALDDYTLKVDVNYTVPYWDELLSRENFIPVKEGSVDNEGMWAAKAETFVCNGPYIMTKWVHNSIITLEKNYNYPDADKITMPKINFYLSDNENNEFANFMNGDWDYNKSIPTNEIKNVKTNHPQYYQLASTAGTYYINWNLDFDLSPVGKAPLDQNQQAEVRRALSMLIDRNYIVDNIVQGGQLPASSFIPYGITDSNDDQFYQKAGKAGNPIYGYWKVAPEDVADNYKHAKEILSKYYTFNDEGYITDFPSVSYLYNTNEGHKAIAEYLQSVYSGIGINFTLENQEWATFLATTKQGQFSACRETWMADYNDASCFTSLFTTTSPNNKVQLGKKNHADDKLYTLDLTDVPGYNNVKIVNDTWANTYDVLGKLISAETNEQTRDLLLHKAEDMLMETGTVMPLYFYTSASLLQPNVKGFFQNSNGNFFFMYCTKE